MKRGRKPIKTHTKMAVVAELIKGKKTDVVIADRLGISSKTVQRIKSSESDLIKAKKEKYIKLIDRYTRGDDGQAKVLSDCLNAETEVFNFKGECIGTRPDHKIRLDTVKYIDKLKGREQPSIRQTQNNTFISKDLDRYM